MRTLMVWLVDRCSCGGSRNELSLKAHTGNSLAYINFPAQTTMSTWKTVSAPPRNHHPLYSCCHRSIKAFSTTTIQCIALSISGCHYTGHISELTIRLSCTSVDAMSGQVLIEFGALPSVLHLSQCTAGCRLASWVLPTLRCLSMKNPTPGRCTEWLPGW